MVVGRRQRAAEHPQHVGFAPAEVDFRLVVRDEFVARAWAADGGDAALEPPFRELALPVFGVGDERTVRGVHEALGDGEHRRRLRHGGQHVLVEPLHAERADTADDDVRASERLVQILDRVELHAPGEVAFEFRMPPGCAADVDDFPVEVRADEADFVAVLARRERQGRAHHARADDGDDLLRRLQGVEEIDRVVARHGGGAPGGCPLVVRDVLDHPQRHLQPRRRGLAGHRLGGVADSRRHADGADGGGEVQVVLHEPEHDEAEANPGVDGAHRAKRVALERGEDVAPLRHRGGDEVPHFPAIRQQARLAPELLAFQLELDRDVVAASEEGEEVVEKWNRIAGRLESEPGDLPPRHLLDNPGAVRRGVQRAIVHDDDLVVFRDPEVRLEASQTVREAQLEARRGVVVVFLATAAVADDEGLAVRPVEGGVGVLSDQECPLHGGKKRLQASTGIGGELYHVGRRGYMADCLRKGGPARAMAAHTVSLFRFGNHLRRSGLL